jgi:excisionase family DNA binding protein
MTRHLSPAGHTTSPHHTSAGLDDDALLLPEQVAALLQVTPRMVRELWARRELDGVKVGKLVRHRRSDVRAYLDAQSVKVVVRR